MNAVYPADKHACENTMKVLLPTDLEAILKQAHSAEFPSMSLKRDSAGYWRTPAGQLYLPDVG